MGLTAAWQQRSAWVIKSKAATLLALIANRQGSAYLAELLPQLLTFAQQGPAAAQIVRILSTPPLNQCNWLAAL